MDEATHDDITLVIGPDFNGLSSDSNEGIAPLVHPQEAP